MGISTWRAKRQMKYPERGVLRVTGFYDALSHSAPSGTRITGIITAPGIPDTPVEHKADDQDSWAGVREVPVLVDRADPSRFLILWDEAQPISFRDQEPQAAPQEADRMTRGQYGSRTSVTSTVVTIGPDGQPASGPMSPETAAQVQAALGNVFGPAGGEALGQMLNQVAEQFGQPPRQPYGQPGEQRYGQGFAQDYGQPAAQAFAQDFGQPAVQDFGQAGAQDYGQAGAQDYGQPAAQDYGQAGGQGFAQVDPQAFDQDPQAFEQPRGGFNPAEAAQFAAGGAEQATAMVLAARDVPGTAPGGTVDLTLEVTRADGSTYTTATRLSFATPERRAAVAIYGTMLRVRIDPNVPARIEIDPSSLF
jgi:hypothetical protein